MVQGELDRRAVKWSLIAAAFALSIGCYAEFVLASHEDAPSTAAVQQSPVDEPVAAAVVTS